MLKLWAARNDEVRSIKIFQIFLMICLLLFKSDHQLSLALLLLLQFNNAENLSVCPCLSCCWLVMLWHYDIMTSTSHVKTLPLLSHSRIHIYYLAVDHNNIFISLPASHPVTDKRCLNTSVCVCDGKSGNLFICLKTTSSK